MGDSERPAYVARVVKGIGEIDAGDWDACAGADNPFVSHAFLAALEESGSAAPETGWAPHHMLLEDALGRVQGVAPLYLKNHSQGEYVFDHGWADAFERAGGRYYPKLQLCVPFSPVTGPRLMVRPGPAAGAARSALIAACKELTERTGISSLHVTFATQDDWRALAAAGFLQRSDRQFHWTNDGYADFEGFLASLASRKRKAVRRERRGALSSGLAIEILTGNDFKTKHWDAFFACYVETSHDKWGTPYLNREFFARLGETMADKVALITAVDDGRIVAGALNLIGADTLYGRNWGCLGHYPFLHFEVCYYSAIEFAIERGLTTVEAGAQGPHKIARGYLPVRTHSAHWISHPGLRDAIEDYLMHERDAVDGEIEALGEYSPFRKED
jgi:predicted N-acyltransferase